jgi:hypothetical protein
MWDRSRIRQQFRSFQWRHRRRLLLCLVPPTFRTGMPLLPSLGVTPDLPSHHGCEQAAQSDDSFALWRAVGRLAARGLGRDRRGSLDLERIDPYRSNWLGSDQETVVRFLKTRRKAKKPVMPMLSRNIEAGSGTA